MSAWEGKSRGGSAGYRFFIFLLKYPGLRFSYFFLRFVVLYYVLFAPGSRNPIFYYFNKIQGFSYWRSVRYVFLNFYRLGQVLLDKVALLAGFNEKFTFDFEGENYLHQMSEDQGGFLIGAHIGNWEIAGQLLERIKTTVHILMLEAEHQQIKSLLDSVLTQKRMSIITIKDDYSHLIKIRQALQNNEMIALHGDRFIEGSPTVTRKLLGKEAKFPYGPFFMAVKYGKPVSFVSAVKETNTHYHLYATQPKYYTAGRDKQEIQDQIDKMLNAYTLEMERVLRIYPEQWFNYYYFWEPDGNDER